MSQIGRKDASEADAPQGTAESRAEEAGPVVAESEMARLREALRGLLAEGLPAEAVEDAASSSSVRSSKRTTSAVMLSSPP
jgi:hypothetical protein